MKETDVGNEIISRREMLAGAAGVTLVSALAAQTSAAAQAPTGPPGSARG